MEERRGELAGLLRRQYRRGGWRSKQGTDGIIEATGPGGVTWIGRVVLADDFDDDFEAEIIELSQRRMTAGGELCPLDLLPDTDCEPLLRDLLQRTGLDRRPHVSVYSLAA